VGELAGGVAHDFNNLLVGVLGSADLLLAALRERGLAPDLQEYAATIRKASLRAADLTAQLLAFSRKEVLRREPVDLHEQLAEVVHLLEPSLGPEVELRQELGATTRTVDGDPTRLLNALLNLCVNARDAMPEGGTLTLATRELSPEEARAAGLELPDAPGFLEVSIQDTGVGIPEDLRPRIFEPFFTTKATGEGTGLGLAAVYGTVRAHGGTIHVLPGPGGGSVFRLLLPLTEPPSQPPAPRPVPPGLIPGEGRILLVDDEELVRVLGSTLLERLGYEVLTAEDGAAGLEVYRQQGDRIDAVILDLVMPRLDGGEALRRLRELDEAVPVLISSGYAAGDASHEEVRALADGFLQKPYVAADFSAALAAVLARKGEEPKGP